MALIKDVFLDFNPSDSPDVVGHNLYVTLAPAPVDAVDANGDYTAQSFDIGMDSHVDLNDIPGFPTADGVYNLGITAVDDVGNESSMLVVPDVPLDFTAPNPPTSASISRV